MFGVCLLIVLVGGQAGAFLPDRFLAGVAERTAALRADFLAHFFPSDALWYQRIARDWYVWDPSRPGVQQDVAFFPLWPAVLWVIGFVAPNPVVARWLAVLVAAGCALGSVFAFARLAWGLLPERGAKLAVWLFMLWPAANFLFESYPTGLMNWLAVLALLSAMERRFWRAAGWSGLLTAAGPLGLGTAMAVWVCAALRARGWRDVGRLAALGVLSIAGLLGFMLLQLVKFHDPLAFVKAQEAWAPQLSWGARVPVAVLQVLVVPDFVAAVRGLKHVLHPPSLIWLQLAVQKSLYLVLEGVALLSVGSMFFFEKKNQKTFASAVADFSGEPPTGTKSFFASFFSKKEESLPVVLQGFFTLALFIWFHSTSRPGNAVPRLLYPDMAMFLGAAWMLQDRPRLAAVAIVVSGALLAGAEFLTVAGYGVT